MHVCLIFRAGNWDLIGSTFLNACAQIELTTRNHPLKGLYIQRGL